ncbi:GPI transamidase component [Elasticomyces elasticus]|nr:GPI transamidase component [Elasticomyces elasticus]KAK4982970.1 GPI transamidase component [Elasticomyces elasticus]
MASDPAQATGDFLPSEDREPVNAVGAAKVIQSPPPEQPKSIWTRRYIIFSFWAIVVCFGLPLWIRTTTVYRADLPLRVMQQWADGLTCQFEVPLHVVVEAPGVSPTVAERLAQTLEEYYNEQNLFPIHGLRVTLSDPPQYDDGSQTPGSDRTGLAGASSNTVLTVRLKPSESESTALSRLDPYEAVLDVYYSPQHLETTRTTEPHTRWPFADVIVGEIQKVFAEEQAALAHLFINSGSPVKIDHLDELLYPQRKEKLARRATRSFKYAPVYHLTFSLFTPAATPSAWEIKAALDEYLEPLLRSFTTISNFTIDTQIQLFASFSPSIHGPLYDAESHLWTLQKTDLSGFINAAEWPLSPSIGEGPTINFILYVPGERATPLVIAETGGTSWLIPQWGGVQILNLERESGDRSMLTEADLKQVVFTFADQLTSLLGLPTSPASHALRISSLTRSHTISLILSASSTLGSLARLTQKLPQISIPDTVAKSVDMTIHHLESACNSLKAGEFSRALEHARTAEAEAEKAFFEPSMVGQVYFPDEHKVAVYLPLLGPVAVPLIMAVIKEVRAWRAARRKGG